MHESIHASDRTPLRPGNAAAAIIVVDDGRYLLQLRDDKPGIFFPGHWGLFGGGVEPDERPDEALRRELQEELGLSAPAPRLLSHFEFRLASMGNAPIYREYYEVRLPTDTARSLRVSEGAGLALFTREQMLGLHRLAPYDAFALWFHANEFRLQS